MPAVTGRTRVAAMPGCSGDGRWCGYRFLDAVAGSAAFTEVVALFFGGTGGSILAGVRDLAGAATGALAGVVL
jgi:hypothetical protein